MLGRWGGLVGMLSDIFSIIAFVILLAFAPTAPAYRWSCLHGFLCYHHFHAWCSGALVAGL